MLVRWCGVRNHYSCVLPAPTITPVKGPVLVMVQWLGSRTGRITEQDMKRGRDFHGYMWLISLGSVASAVPSVKLLICIHRLLGFCNSLWHSWMSIYNSFFRYWTFRTKQCLNEWFASHKKVLFLMTINQSHHCSVNDLELLLTRELLGNTPAVAGWKNWCVRR